VSSANDISSPRIGVGRHPVSPRSSEFRAPPFEVRRLLRRRGSTIRPKIVRKSQTAQQRRRSEDDRVRRGRATSSVRVCCTQWVGTAYEKGEMYFRQPKESSLRRWSPGLRSERPSRYVGMNPLLKTVIVNSIFDATTG